MWGFAGLSQMNVRTFSIFKQVFILKTLSGPNVIDQQVALVTRISFEFLSKV